MQPSIRPVIGFFIVIEVADCSEFPSEAVECLAQFLDEQKPVIIQWDLMDSAEHLVFYKKPDHRVFCALIQFKLISPDTASIEH